MAKAHRNKAMKGLEWCKRWELYKIILFLMPYTWMQIQALSYFSFAFHHNLALFRKALSCPRPRIILYHIYLCSCKGTKMKADKKYPCVRWYHSIRIDIIPTCIYYWDLTACSDKRRRTRKQLKNIHLWVCTNKPGWYILKLPLLF